MLLVISHGILTDGKSKLQTINYERTFMIHELQF